MSGSATTVRPVPETAPPWHALACPEAVAHLRTDPLTGLDDAEARQRLLAAGPNRLPPPPRAHPLTILLRQLRLGSRMV